MSTLFEKSAKISQVVTTTVEKAKALEDSGRAAILDLLSRKAMSVEEIVEELKHMGEKMAPTTVRHHIDVLKRVGFVELVRVKEVRGGVLKYYAAKARFLGYEVAQDFDRKMNDIITETSAQILEMVGRLVKTRRDLLRQAAHDLKPCPYCSPQHFEEYVIVEVFQRALARATQMRKFSSLLKRLEARAY